MQTTLQHYLKPASILGNARARSACGVWAGLALSRRALSCAVRRPSMSPSSCCSISIHPRAVAAPLFSCTVLLVVSLAVVDDVLGIIQIRGPDPMRPTQRHRRVHGCKPTQLLRGHVLLNSHDPAFRMNFRCPRRMLVLRRKDAHFNRYAHR